MNDVTEFPANITTSERREEPVCRRGALRGLLWALLFELTFLAAAGLWVLYRVGR
jgi:hypothetical protein